MPEGLINFDDYVEWGFDDEYMTCDECRSAVRISPDSYSWQPEYVLGDGYILCANCITEDDLEPFINNHKTAVPPIFDLEKMGWTELDERHDRGLHAGQNDSPELISAILNAKGIDHVFTMATSQFTTSFWVYVRDEDAEIANSEISIKYRTPATGPSDRLKSALKQAGGHNG